MANWDRSPPPKPAPKPVEAGQNISGGYTETLKTPVKGRISSPYSTARKNPVTGKVKPHTGVDIAAPNGTPVRASASGKVTWAGPRGGYGLQVRIDHGGGTETSYAHLSKIAVSAGSSVSQGEIIGYVGSTGQSTGNHLHYEVRKNGVPINPMTTTTTVSPDENNMTMEEKKKREAAEAAGKAYDHVLYGKPFNDEELNKRVGQLQYNQEEVIRKLLSGEHFQDNAANNFHNLTYHWRLFITTDQENLVADAVNGDGGIQGFYEELAKYEQVTIAESGVTSFSIDSVTINSVVGTDYLAGSTLFTNMEMKVTEPNGILFMDALRSAAIKVGVRNYQKCYYYLELTFKGYDEDGAVNLTPFPDLPNGGKWVWSVMLTDIDVNMSAGGGTYTLSMTPLNDSMMVSRLNTIPFQTEVTGNTVGEFMRNLCTRLNMYWTVIKGEPGIVEYDVKFHPVEGLLTADEIMAMPISNIESEYNEERTNSLNFDANRTAHISKGFTISEVLDALMRACETAQNLAKDSKTNAFWVDGSNNSINKTGYRQSVIWRIEPEISHPDYDPVFEDYYKKITLHVYGFRHHTAVLSALDTMSEEDSQRAIIADLAARNFLPKKYEYLFTGLNTEVLDMDLSFNLKWAAVLPRMVGASQEQVETHAKARPDSDKNHPISAARSSSKSKTEQAADQAAAGAAIPAFNVEYIELKTKLDNEEITQEEYDTQYAEIKKREIEAQAKFGEISQDTRQMRRDLKAQYPNVAPSKTYEREYGEEMARRRVDFTEQEEKTVFPVSIDVYDSEDIGITGQYHPGKSIYGAVLNQVYGPLSDKLFKVDITVRGDPFWIGPGSFELASMRKDSFDPRSTSWPNFREGCNTILVRMAYPLGQDDQGNTILNTDETATGIYQVNSITHKFDNGEFTQVMKTIRVAMIDLYKALYQNIYNNGGTPSSGGE